MNTIKNYLGRNFKSPKRADKLSKSHRSRLMSKIRSQNTAFEKEFVEAFKKTTRRKFILNLASIKGKPDIVFLNEKICVFLDSDFWHGWQYSRWKHRLKNDFWKNKILNNRKRDKRITKYLKSHGWTVIRIWEHQLKKNQPFYLKKIRKFLLK